MVLQKYAADGTFKIAATGQVGKMGLRPTFIAVAFCFASSNPAWAESWDCKIPTLSFDQIEPWDVRGDRLIGPSVSDPPEPRRTFKIIMETDQALIAFNSNDRLDGVALNLVRLDKLSGKIQWRLIYMTGDYQERYEGSCHRAKR